jgi:RimJ/RimL family protein N-acetyltransferase
VNVREARPDDREVVAGLLDEATRWVAERGFEQWPLPFPRAQIAEAIACVRLDCLGDSEGIRRYYERLGFEHRGDLVRANRNMGIYERRVQA